MTKLKGQKNQLKGLKCDPVEGTQDPAKGTLSVTQLKGQKTHLKGLEVWPS